MDISAIKERMDSAYAEVKAAKEAAVAKGKLAFGEACKELFAAYPKLQAFRWTQYTPYFNDGDSCEFSANEVEHFKVEGVTSEDGEDEDDFVYDYDLPSDMKEMSKDVQAVRELLDEDALEDMFGDHVQVTVTADGVETEEYSHD